MMVKPVQLAPFINRHKEINLIRDKLEMIKSQKWVFDFILTISGIPGIGKTTLLAKAQKEARSRNIASVWIDCQTAETEINSIHILQEIADRFFEQAATWLEALKDYRDNEGHPVQQAYYQERLIDAFVEDLRLKLEQDPLVLLIDNSQYMNDLAREILEDILERIHNQNRLLVVLAGRADLRWHSFELRRRTRVLSLGPFAEAEADQLLTEPISPGLSKQVYRLTNGYPLASVQAYEWIAAHLKPLEPDLSHQLKAHEANLVFELVNSILADHVLGHIPDYDTRIRLDWLLKNISPLRRFDDNLLHALLRELDKARFGQITTLEARGYTRQMAALTYLVKWDSARMAYAVDFSLRRLLSLEMNFRDVSRLLEIHKFVMGWYKKAIDEVTARDVSAPQSVIYLIEYIFHMAQSWKIKDQPEHLRDDIQQQIAHYFKGYHMRERVHFREEFSKDEELAELLGEAYNSLTEFVTQLAEFESQI